MFLGFSRGIVLYLKSKPTIPRDLSCGGSHCDRLVHLRLVAVRLLVPAIFAMLTACSSVGRIPEEIATASDRYPEWVVGVGGAHRRDARSPEEILQIATLRARADLGQNLASRVESNFQLIENATESESQTFLSASLDVSSQIQLPQLQTLDVISHSDESVWVVVGINRQSTLEWLRLNRDAVRTRLERILLQNPFRLWDAVAQLEELNATIALYVAFAESSGQLISLANEIATKIASGVEGYQVFGPSIGAVGSEATWRIVAVPDSHGVSLAGIPIEARDSQGVTIANTTLGKNGTAELSIALEAPHERYSVWAPTPSPDGGAETPRRLTLAEQYVTRVVPQLLAIHQCEGQVPVNSERIVSRLVGAMAQSDLMPIITGDVPATYRVQICTGAEQLPPNAADVTIVNLETIFELRSNGLVIWSRTRRDRGAGLTLEQAISSAQDRIAETVPEIAQEIERILSIDE